MGKKTLVFAIIVVQLITLYYLGKTVFKQDIPQSPAIEFIGTHPVWKNYVIDTPNCKIPDMDIMDNLIAYLIFPVGSPYCTTSSRQPQLVASNLTAIYIVESALRFYNINNVGEQLDCCYRTFKRPPSSYLQADEAVMLGTECYKFKNETTIKHEFIHVLCKIKNKETITSVQDIHAFVPNKEKTILTNGTEKGISVLILGVDSVSRLNLYRQMPKTLEILRQLAAVEFMGYNKVGDNTFDNLVPAFTGLNVDELKKLCWHSNKVTFDNCPLIWKKFYNAGFYTAFGEDYADSSFFNLKKEGFKEQPTSFYTRPFFLLGDKKFDSLAGKCYGSTLKARKLLEYMTKFVTSMKEKYFSLFWETTITHNELNYPSVIDEMLSSFLETVKNDLNNTVLVFMSDHGARVGQFAETYQGSLENRLPVLFFVFPNWFRRQYKTAMKNMLKNTRRLTTLFDLHETLLDFLDLNSLKTSVLKKREIAMNQSTPRGISLFIPVSVNRTCSDAGINPHWCTCHQSEQLPINDPIIYVISHKLVQKLNDMLSSFHKCAYLRLMDVKDIRVHVPPRRKYIKDYYVIITTLPGRAIFGGTVRNITHENGDFSLEVEGDIDRLNKYGNQSACITDHKYHPFCYCL